MPTPHTAEQTEDELQLDHAAGSSAGHGSLSGSTAPKPHVPSRVPTHNRVRFLDPVPQPSQAPHGLHDAQARGVATSQPDESSSIALNGQLPSQSPVQVRRRCHVPGPQSLEHSPHPDHVLQLTCTPSTQGLLSDDSPVQAP